MTDGVPHAVKVRKDHKRAARLAARAYVNGVLDGAVCGVCQLGDTRVLQFHHNDPREKVSEVSNLVSKGAPIGVVRKEIEKCTILCANCHAILHHEERKHVKRKREERQRGASRILDQAAQ